MPQDVKLLRPRVLGVVGGTFPICPTWARNNLKVRLHRALRNETGIQIIPKVDYALITLDPEIGPWVCNWLHLEHVPYVVAVPEKMRKPFSTKCQYWLRKAAGIIFVPQDQMPEKKQAPGMMPGDDYQCWMVARNRYVMAKSTSLVICSPRPQSVVWQWTTKLWPGQYKELQPAELWPTVIKEDTLTLNEKVSIATFNTHEIQLIHEFERSRAYKKRREARKNASLKVSPKTGVIFQVVKTGAPEECWDDDIPF
jgi:hypothetical protein